MTLDWRNLPALSTLRAFEATARLEGYSAAARALNVTPAAIAQQVRKLEADIGTALVRREGRGLVLTRAGQQLAAPLHLAFSQISDAIDELRLQEATRGVHVSTTDFFGSAVILPWLGEFWKAHPGIEVTITPEGNPKPVDLDRFDIVIRGAAPDHDWVVPEAIPLLTTDMIIAGAPSLVGSSPPDLSSLPWVKDLSTGGDVFDMMVRRAGCDPDAINLFDPGDARFEIDAGVLGYGLLSSPEITIRRELEAGTLVRLDVPLGMTGVYSALTGKGPLRAPVAVFLEWLVQHCRSQEKG